MTNDFRAMCAELFVKLKEWDSSDPYHDCGPLLCRARALLAQPEPVAEGPTDEELLRVAATGIEPYEISGITPGEYEPETECAVEAYGSELIAFAREVLHRWGRPTPQPVADGEVAELVAWLRESLDCALQSGNSKSIKNHCRLLDLLGRPTPQPVAVSEHPWERDGWCDEQGRCWWTANKPGPLPPSWWMVSIPQACTDGIMLPAHALPTPEATND